jgi:hypothetical protein
VYSHVRVRTFSFSHIYPAYSLSVQWTYLNTCSHAHLDISRASFCTCSDRYQPEHRASGVRPLLWRGLLYYRGPKIVITVDLVKLNEVKCSLLYNGYPFSFAGTKWPGRERKKLREVRWFLIKLWLVYANCFRRGGISLLWKRLQVVCNPLLLLYLHFPCGIRKLTLLRALWPSNVRIQCCGNWVCLQIDFSSLTHRWNCR